MQGRKSIVLAVAALTITAIAVWHGQRTIIPEPATWDDVLAEAKAGGYKIITTAALAERYRQDPSGLMLVDTRQEWEYRTGHIDGARNFSMEPTWWARWRRAGDLNEFLGPDKERVLVFY